MSHFTVLVIGDNWEDQLTPFCEHDEGGDEYRKHMEFQDKTQNVEHEFQSATQVMYLDEENNAYYDDPRNEDKLQEYTDKGFKRVDVLISQLGWDLERFAKDEGYRRDETTGKWGWWTNPNAKWDWYSLGGRWTGMLKVKEGVEPTLGRPGIFGPDKGVAEDKLRADQCLKGDLDIEGMLELRRKERNGYWENAKKEYNKNNPDVALFEEVLKTWCDALNRCRKEWEDDGSPGAFHKKIEADDEARTSRQALGFYGAELFDEPCPENPTKKLYIEMGSKLPFSTYAVLMDGEWHQRGEMGWFGMSSNEVAEEEWQENFTKLIEELPDDTLLSVVDCHI